MLYNFDEHAKFCVRVFDDFVYYITYCSSLSPSLSLPPLSPSLSLSLPLPPSLSAIPVHLISSVSLTSIIHSPVTLPCHVEPDQSILYTWTKDNQPLSLPSPGYQLLVNGSLYIQSTAVNQQGGYVCTAANSAGSSQGTVTLTVQG